MKKLLIGISTLFLLAGCDSETKSLSCISTNEANGIETNVKYEIKYEGDNVKHVTIVTDYNSVANNNNEKVDGTDVDTDGLDRNDTDNNNDLNANDVVDGVVGDTIDGVVDGVKDTILDLSGLKKNNQNQLNTFNNIEGFTYEVNTDNDNEYKITYEIDMDQIDDANLNRFNITRDFSNMKSNYENSGYICE